jgi:hypothetical protein
LVAGAGFEPGVKDVDNQLMVLGFSRFFFGERQFRQSIGIYGFLTCRALFDGTKTLSTTG